MRDPDTRALPTLVETRPDDETGRGMVLVDVAADRWGVVLDDDSKITWCELETGLTSANGHVSMPEIGRAEALLGLYGAVRWPGGTHGCQLNLAVAEESAIDVIADVLQWLRAHGCDAEEALDRARMHCEAQLGWIP
ncbi:hypothetical protein [Streptomyces sp. NPDC004726]